jgi:hypothetical protein
VILHPAADAEECEVVPPFHAQPQIAKQAQRPSASSRWRSFQRSSSR